MTAARTSPQLTLLSRAECELCERLLAQITALRARVPIPGVEVIDVDSDPLLARRWGLQVPVLLLDGVRVCGPELDSSELLRLLRL